MDTYTLNYNEMREFLGQKPTNQLISESGRYTITGGIAPNGDINVEYRSGTHTVLTYHAGSPTVTIYCNIDPYTSSHTVALLLRPKVRKQSKKVTKVIGKYYYTPDTVCICTDTWEVVGGAEPFRHYKLDVSRAQKALHESGYYKYYKWCKALSSLGVERGYTTEKGENINKEVLQYLLSGPDGWCKLRGLIHTEDHKIRNIVYANYDCYDVMNSDYLTSVRIVKDTVRIMHSVEGCKQHGE